MTNEQITKRDQIIDAAVELFSEHGFEGTSTRMIAQKANVNLAMLSYYFGGKEQLFGALVEKKLQFMQLVMANLKEEDTSSWNKIERLIDIHIERVSSNRNFSRIIQREASLNQRSDLTEIITSAVYKNMVLFRDLIVQGQERGEFRTDIDIPFLMASFYGTVSQVIYSPAMCARLIDEDDTPETVLSERNISRLKAHLKRMMHDCLEIKQTPENQ